MFYLVLYYIFGCECISVFALGAQIAYLASKLSSTSKKINAVLFLWQTCYHLVSVLSCFYSGRISFHLARHTHTRHCTLAGEMYHYHHRRHSEWVTWLGTKASNIHNNHSTSISNFLLHNDNLGKNGGEQHEKHEVVQEFVYLNTLCHFQLCSIMLVL